MKPYQYRIIV